MEDEKHAYASVNLNIIGSDKAFVAWSNADLLSFGRLGTKLSEFWIKIHQFQLWEWILMSQEMLKISTIGMNLEIAK